ncbi:hypothetical protein DNL40_05695 [Xylanimonas oleitrophica]|uniref:Protein-glutamine gamma-glutamyltransferase-like C-terminal domain-containing protein n=2 Tax=Xylanimonas oleitrophica TaxID=2607479 RepID=A0A2W5WUC9_9MICO|nr:hypothetical protein DNL40_05695 [Xylanimonas oleitrophica]
MVEELSRPEYDTSPSLLERLLGWFLSLFDGAVPAFAGPSWQVVLVIVAVTAAVVALAWWVAGPVRLSRRRRRATPLTAADDERTAAQLRAAADDAAARGDWSVAVAERFRAVVRSLEERTVLDERPGRTAQEAAGAAGARLPRLATDLHRGATLFDDVVYGELPAGPEDDAWLRELAARAADEPLETAPAVGPGSDTSPTTSTTGASTSTTTGPQR